MVSAIDFTDLPPISDATGFYYGLGVGSYDYAGHQVIEKGGALAGVRTIIVLVPDKNDGIVVLANLNLTAFPEAVRAYFLNQVLGLDPQAEQKQILARNEQLKNLMAPPPPPKVPENSMDRCSRWLAFTKTIITGAARSCPMAQVSKSNSDQPNIPPP